MIRIFHLSEANSLEPAGTPKPPPQGLPPAGLPRRDRQSAIRPLTNRGTTVRVAPLWSANHDRCERHPTARALRKGPEAARRSWTANCWMKHYRSGETAHHSAGPRPVRANRDSVISRQHRAFRPLSCERHVLRSAKPRASEDHLLSRPARCPGEVHDHHRRRQEKISRAPVQREPDQARGPAGWQAFVTWHDPFPKPAYLFALVGGDLARIEDRFTTMSGEGRNAPTCVQHHNREERCGHAWIRSKAMKWDEAYGREYDLDLFA